MLPRRRRRALGPVDRTGSRGRPQREGRLPIAIVGMAAQFGPIGAGWSFENHILGESPTAEPVAPPNWWGIPGTNWYRRAGWDARSFRGHYIDSVEFRVDQFRIPPRELSEMLPQQSLMLDVAARALRDANWQSSAGTADRHSHRRRARSEYDQLSLALVVARAGARLESEHSVWT